MVPNNAPIKFSSFGGYRRFCRRWWKDLWRTITVGWIYDVQAYWHRARYGWAPKDTWSLDHYLDSVIGASLMHLAEKSHSVPCGYPKQNVAWSETFDVDAAHARWRSDLRRWGQAFLDAAAIDDLYDVYGSDYYMRDIATQERIKRRGDALIEMIPWWDSLWD